MRINRDNYEQWLIDYMEGRLAPSMEDEVRSFLALNPEIAEEFDGLDDISLPGDAEALPGKELLLAATSGLPPLDHPTFDLWLAARMEGDLDPGQENELAAFISANPQYRTDEQLMKRTRLSPDLRTGIKSKALLKRIQVPLEVHQGNITDWLLARMEGQTSEPENRAIGDYLSANPAARHEESLLAMTRLVPDPDVRFDGKDRLRRHVIPLFNQRTGRRLVSMAAAFLILIGSSLWIGLFRNTEPVSINWETTAWNLPGIPLHRQVTVQQTVTEVNHGMKTTQQQKSMVPPVHVDAIAPRPASFVGIPVRAQTEGPAQSPYLAQAVPGTEAAGQETHTMSLKEFATLRLRRFTYGEEEEQNPDERISRWELADAGITGFNRLTGSNIRFDRELDSTGKLRSYKLGGERFYFARK